MNDRTGHATLEQNELYASARLFDHLREVLSVPAAPSDIVGLARAARQLAELTDLVYGLSDHVHGLATDDDPGANLAPVMSAFAAAAVPAGRAVENYAEVLHQVSFLNQYGDAPASPDLDDARQAAFYVIQERLGLVRDNLQEVADTLRGGADRLNSTPSRVHAALSRSADTVAFPAPASPEPATTAQTPIRLAYTPAPRHAR